MTALKIYTDGAAKGNPGPGGYGVVMTYGRQVKEISAGYRLTTNNRMELMAVIVALESLKKEGLELTVYTDSKYVRDAVEQKWIWGWLKTGFKGKKNADLWMRFIGLHRKHHIRIEWVKGHAGHPQNERCDYLATTAASVPPLLIDEGYEREQKNSSHV